eukprot:139277_1
MSDNVKYDNYCTLIVYGYIHEIEKLLYKNQNNIIPQTLIEQCLIFYLNSIKLFIQKFGGFDYQHDELYCCDMVNKTITKLTNKQSQKPYKKCFDRWCHIPNISSSINLPSNINKNKSYDGILGVCSPSMMYPQHLVLNLMESEYMNKKHIEYDSFVSFKTRSGSSHDFIYCSPKHGIISQLEDNYGWETTYMVQLKFNEIILSANDTETFLEFKMIKEDKQFISKSTSDSRYSYTQSYIDDNDKLFCVESINYMGYNSKLERREQNVKFGIFDLNEYKWQLIHNQKFTSTVLNECSLDCVICKNNGIDAYLVYMILNDTLVSKYDINKNKWMNVYEQMVTKKAPKIKNVWL